MKDNQGFLPTSVMAGETIWVAAANTAQSSADIILPNYLPASFSLAYQFAAATPLTVAAAANGDDDGWTLTVTAAQTLLWKAGVINFAAFVTELAVTARVFSVDAGFIRVAASPLAVSDYAAALTAIETAISTFSAGGIKAFSLGDMQITYNSVSELFDLRDFYKSESMKQLSTRPRRIIRTRFT